jgi:hypothetical protein
MKSLLSSLSQWFEHLFVDQGSLESYLRGAASLADVESRQAQWSREAGHNGLFA